MVSARTLYKYSTHFHRHPHDRLRNRVLSLEACVREIYRVFAKVGSLEYNVFDRGLMNVGQLPKELEPFLYEGEHSSCTDICMEGQPKKAQHTVQLQLDKPGIHHLLFRKP